MSCVLRAWMVLAGMPAGQLEAPAALFVRKEGIRRAAGQHCGILGPSALLATTFIE